MKLLFSEGRPDYGHFVFPYAVWAFPEAAETPADLFAAGFLPSSRQLDRFYLCRHLRVRLAAFRPSSENRRILRKGAGLTATLRPRADFLLTPARREFCRRYTEAKFGGGGWNDERIDGLFAGAVTTHVLQFTESATGWEVGLATLYVEGRRMAFYSYAFYDLAEAGRSLGMYMMTTAVAQAVALGCAHLYLGTCYSESALYKVQFAGGEFFNGVRWSDNMEELKYMVRRGLGETREHLLEDAAYRELSGTGDLGPLAAASPFRGVAET